VRYRLVGALAGAFQRHDGVRVALDHQGGRRHRLQIRYGAGCTSKLYGTTNPSDDARFIYMLREPMGVCALINAWNAPLAMAGTKIAPALARGNTVQIKPAELTTLRLAELIELWDCPPAW